MGFVVPFPFPQVTKSQGHHASATAHFSLKPWLVTIIAMHEKNLQIQTFLYSFHNGGYTLSATDA